CARRYLYLTSATLFPYTTLFRSGGFRLDLDFGPTQDIVNATDTSGPHIFRNLGQAYLSYQADVGKGLQIDFGKFVTALGFEVIRSEEHTSELQSRFDLVCRLLLE